MGAVNVVYAADMASANVSVRALHRTNASVVAYFDGKATGSMWQRFTSATASGPVSVSLNASDGSTITLEPIDFVWNVPAVETRVCRSCVYGGGRFCFKKKTSPKWFWDKPCRSDSVPELPTPHLLTS